MKKYTTILSLSLITLLMLMVYGCGSSSPTSSTMQRQSQTTTPTLVNGNALTVAVSFPVKPITGPTALISASTSYFEIWVRKDAGALVGPIIGYAKVTSPAGGGTATVKVDLNPYVGLATVEVWGYNLNGNGNSFMWNDINIAAANNPPVSIVVVEMGQGVNVAAGTPGGNLLSPDGVTYPITKIFVDTTNRVAVQGAYELGVQTTIPGSTSAGVFTSKGSSIPFGTLASWVGGFWADGTTNNILQMQWDIVNGNPNFYVDVPNAPKTAWNRYEVKLNFQPGGIPTNTPTITTIFRGTLALDALNNAIASTGATITTPAASGTVLLNIPNANWTNNVAPAPNAQGIVLF